MTRAALSLMAVTVLFVWTTSDALAGPATNDIVRPKPAPRVETTYFGFAKPAPTRRFHDAIVKTSTAPILERCVGRTRTTWGVEDWGDASVAEDVVEEAPVVRVQRLRKSGRTVKTYTRVYRIGCDPCGTCSPCEPSDACACSPCTTRCFTYRDKSCVPSVHWSSGYHDGRESRLCDPCTTTRCVSRPVCTPCYRPVCRPVVRSCWRPCGWGWGGCGGWGWGFGGCW